MEGPIEDVTALKLLEDEDDDAWPKVIESGTTSSLVLRGSPKVLRCVRYAYTDDPENYARSVPSPPPQRWQLHVMY
ncbi:MAG: hypothetical protein GY740_02090 [Gammaproteobacteria bacterium]|nr:hypothetical protein [Gammaproteobacteria bacterium]